MELRPIAHFANKQDRYVYELAVAERPFYIGAGKGNRLFHHVRNVRLAIERGTPLKSSKDRFIAECLATGVKIVASKIADGLTVDAAYVPGARPTLRELAAQYQVRITTIFNILKRTTWARV